MISLGAVGDQPKGIPRNKKGLSKGIISTFNPHPHHHTRVHCQSFVAQRWLLPGDELWTSGDLQGRGMSKTRSELMLESYYSPY